MMLPTVFYRRQHKISLYTSLIMLASLLSAFRYLGPVRIKVNSIRLYNWGKNAAGSSTPDRYYTDPEYRRQAIDRRIEKDKLRMTWDPDYVVKRKAAWAKSFQKRKSCERTYRRKMFSDWLRSGWHTADLPWKTYRPEVFSQRVVRPCSGCQLPDHRTKFWWTSVFELERHLCGRCALELSWEEVCPKGFENTATLKEFTTRAKELGFNKSSKLEL